MATYKVTSFSGLDEAKQRFQSAVDTVADSARHISPSQVEVYEAKHREAMQGSGPYIEAEADSLGLPLADVIQSVLNARQEREHRNAHIEAFRLKAKRDIRAATTPAEMYAIHKQYKELISGND